MMESRLPDDLKRLEVASPNVEVIPNPKLFEPNLA